MPRSHQLSLISLMSLLALACGPGLCHREKTIASLKTPATTWTQGLFYNPQLGRFGGMDSYGELHVEGYPVHSIAYCHGDEELQGGADWLAYRCDEDWSTLHLGPSLLLGDCSGIKPPLPLSQRWLPVLQCSTNSPEAVLEQAAEAGVLEALLLLTMDVELRSADRQFDIYESQRMTPARVEQFSDPWITSHEALSEAARTSLSTGLRAAFQQPTSPIRLLRAQRLLDMQDQEPSSLLQRGWELLPETGGARTEALTQILIATRGHPDNPALACAALSQELTWWDGTALWLLVEARHRCALPELAPCQAGLGCGATPCDSDTHHARAVEALSAGVLASSTAEHERAWYSYAALMGMLDTELQLKNERLSYTQTPTSPPCWSVTQAGQECNCFDGALWQQRICDLEGERTVHRRECEIIIDDAARTLTGVHLCTGQGETTSSSHSAACCDGLEIHTSRSTNTCVATVETFLTHIATLPPGPPPDPEGLAVLRAQQTLPADLDALLARQDGLHAGQTQIFGAREIATRSSTLGMLTVGQHGDEHLFITTIGVKMGPVDAPGKHRKIGEGLDEAFLKLGMWE